MREQSQLDDIMKNDEVIAPRSLSALSKKTRNLNLRLMMNLKNNAANKKIERFDYWNLDDGQLLKLIMVETLMMANYWNFEDGFKETKQRRERKEVTN